MTRPTSRRIVSRMPAWLSYTVFAICIVAFLGAMLARTPRPTLPFYRRHLPLFVQIAALVVAYITMRPGPGVDPHAALNTARANHRAVMLEFYSAWCSACMMAKPDVDALEERMRGVMDVARIDVGTDTGAQLASQHNITMTPAYVVIDSVGRVVYRQQGGRPQSNTIVSRVSPSVVTSAR